MSASFKKNHDHSIDIIFSPVPTQEFPSIGSSFIFEITGGLDALVSDGGTGLLKLTSYTEESYLETNAGNFNVAADENQIFIQNVPNLILPETDLGPLRLRISNHTNTELNGYFDIQLVSKTTSIINPANFDYTYTIPQDFSTNISFDNSNVKIANIVWEGTNHGFTRQYRWSQNGTTWTDYEDLTLISTIAPEYDDDCGGECPSCEIFPIDPKKPFYLNVRYIRTGLSSVGSLTVNELILHGEHQVKIIRLGELGTIEHPGECLELIQTDIYKVFKITGYEIDSDPANIEDIASIQFQISQDNCRTWSHWCYLTQENLVKYQVDPIRFFHIKYSICLPEDYSGGKVKIYDIILNGNFQNVSVDYVNGGKLGLRPEVYNRPSQQGITLESGGSNYCQTLIGETISTTPLGTNNGDMFVPNADPSKLWNPYALSAATDLYNNLSNISSQMFGFTITYFPVNPDEKGIDRVFHEYQLLNSDECGDVKILVPENQFPDNQIKFTTFDLQLFETFEIHITKDAFKAAFGIQRRPMKRDYLFFPEINRMFEVEHAQANKDFLNTSTYYRVTLKKYNKKANVKQSDSVSSAVDSLTKNTTLDDLFGIEAAKEDKIVNKEQYQTLSDDRIRLNIDKKVSILENNLYNASLILSKTQYNFSAMTPGDLAIEYTRADLNLGKGDNRSIMMWFNITDLDSPDVLEYTFINNYDDTNLKGYKAWYAGKKVHFVLNDQTYKLPVLTIEQDIWYCLLINLSQCDKVLDLHVFKRFTTLDVNGKETDGTELASSRLDEKWHKQFNIEPVEFSINLNASINASYMKLTNIRLFSERMETSSFTKVLNQYIVKKSNFLILGDNCNEKIETRNHS